MLDFQLRDRPLAKTLKEGTMGAKLLDSDKVANMTAVCLHRLVISVSLSTICLSRGEQVLLLKCAVLIYATVK